MRLIRDPKACRDSRGGALDRLTAAADVRGGIEEFEQEIVDQHALAMVGAGLTDGYIDAERSAVIEFARFLGEPLWTATGDDADRYLTWLRRDRG